MNPDRKSMIRAGIVLGFGLGGFVDGILLHQILQWHHMLSSAGFPPDSLRNLEINTLADGLFHAGAWLITVVGLSMLWRATRAERAGISGQVLAGALAAGWGLFNLVEGIIDHQLLGIHHVRLGPDQLAYDLAFLAFGAILLIGGIVLVRRAPETVHESRPAPATR
jgi:uncharacterized membrane protein